MIPMLIAGILARESKERALHLLGLVGLKDRAGQKPETLSGGERQRVAVARAIANSPSLLLADEPTGNLDKENTNELMELLKRINEDLGVTMLIVSHDVGLSNYFHEIYHLEYGTLRRA
jgi:lipoprotein-releasing system ATP-binding protein